ncbi:membrane protein insertase YidC [Chryseobacterium sp. POL2]|uniref:membrane protein insertase YidC n=1 Tax=Chryseobacterium sp. POL2 TaxID=2713414 RepID=UPI0013E137D7|nr:membrane protein insertase YidC [Chryseobacterium sp. POL2]QIG89248.1 membrane protein insertase YidC [Chryseobacterium sp. POL2]
MQQNNGLDKNQLISFGVLSLLLLGFMLYFQNRQVDQEQTQITQQTKKTEQSATANISAANVNNVAANAIQKVNLKNDELSLEFSSLGGQVSTVQLNKYNAFDGKNKNKPLYLFNNKNSDYGFEFKDKSGKLINTKDLVFAPSVNGNTLTLTSQINAATIQFIYTLNPKYTLDFKVRTKGLSTITADTKATFKWNYNVRELEKGRAQEQTHTEFVYAFNNYKDYDYDARTDMDETKETLNWIGVKQQFFVAVLEAQHGFTQSKGFQDNVEEGEYLKKFNYDGQVALTGGEFNQDFSWYFMPLDLQLLKSFDNKNFDEILPLGWSFIGSLNRHVFMPMYDVISSWGIAAGWVIFLMTIIVKLILSPIMYKQHKLSAMMKVIRPEIDEVNKKFKDADPMKKQQETMAVYRKAGVNQLAGCLPALVQVPLFYALFRFFPNMLDLRGKSFWFAEDLTAYDDLIKLPFNIPFLGEHLSIFAIACTAVILIYTMMTAGNIQQPQQEGMPNMKVLMYIFPITFLFFLNTSASGLSWYYFVSNAINIIIILVIKYFILDEKKIHAQIQENKKKAPKPEGRFQKRMREMMEQAQEQQKKQEHMRKKK